jgi:hypothetical protein
MDPPWCRVAAFAIVEEKPNNNINNFAPKTNDSLCYCAFATIGQ